MAALPTYNDLHDYAVAIEADGPHDARIGPAGGRGSVHWTVADYEGELYMFFAKKSGRGYSVTECAYDERMIEALKRTAAIRDRKSA